MIPVQNIYYMLAYAFQVLRESGYRDLATEEFSYAEDLYAAIIIKGVSEQIKQGLLREYIPQTDSLQVLKGKLELAETLRNQSLIKNRVCCTYDEFSLNSLMHRVLKSTMELLLHGDVEHSRKKQIRNLLRYFSSVDRVDLRRLRWNFHYDRTNRVYEMLHNICRMVTEKHLQTQNEGKSRMADFVDEQRMSRLYEKFILEYYKAHYPELSPRSSHILWQLDDGFDNMLPTMRSDITLKKENTVLIIDAKYYSSTFQSYFGGKSISSANLYQIFTYVKNTEISMGSTPHKVSGMLLYAKTDETEVPSGVYQMSGNQITVKTLDLNQSFEGIQKQLDSIVHSHF